MDAFRRSTLSRRAAVRLGGASIATGALSARWPAHATATAEDGAKAPIVLVHGAWAGAWIWKKVIPPLRAAGYPVYASTGTGMGDRVHLADPAIDLDTFVTDVVNLLEFEELTEVTLVGWSYGGMMISGVAERVPERLARLVYLDAFVPADGQSAFEIFGVPPEARPADYFPILTDLVHGMTKDPADVEWLLAKMVRQPSPTLAQPIRIENRAAAALPRAFLHCTEAAFEPFVSTAARLKADPAWTYGEIADTHFSAINAPEATAEAILALL